MPPLSMCSNDQPQHQGGPEIYISVLLHINQLICTLVCVYLSIQTHTYSFTVQRRIYSPEKAEQEII